jgi:hypothetical protein
MKQCNKCTYTKEDYDFSTSNLNRSGGMCKACVKLYNKIYTKQYYIKNKDFISKKHKAYRENNKDLITRISTKYKENNPDYAKKYRNSHRIELRNKKNIYIKKRYKENVNFKLRILVSRSINHGLNLCNSSKNGKSITNFLLYTFEELKNYLQSLFEPWMSWNNHGLYNKNKWNDNDQSTWTWQIDHIIPQNKLPYTSMEDDNFKKCWSLNNLRPLSSKDNVLKGNKVND